MIVGQQDTLERICANTDTSRAGMEIAAAAILPPHDAADVSEGLAAAVTRARQARVEDVVILMDGCDRRDFDTLVAAFGALPVSIQLGVTPAAGRHIDEHVGRLGAVPLLALKRPPMHVGQKVAKRAFDIVVASAALVLLSPLLLLIALLIKLDSPGPVFFRQRRRGYNQEEFRIWKFRTMSTMEDGDVVRQATAGDERVTRLGHYLRRFNLDELPQLLNVLTGEMSIVGPRPHAVAHDRIFEQRIAAYPRRLNVPPGITGWAQVNGLRGATDDERMRQRVAHDLYYIENWSLALDLYILLLTVVSPKAYRNAH
jgi:Undecaprenyl-phosphate glucose phosphotransferase